MRNIESITENIYTLTENLEQYLRPTESIQALWISTAKSVYDFTKFEENRLALPSPNEALSKLHTDDVDAEEVWQQIELQTSSLLSLGNAESLSNETNLCSLVATLSNVAREAIAANEAESEEEDEPVSEEDEEFPSDADLKADNIDDDEDSLDEGVDIGEDGDIDYEEEFDEEFDGGTFSDLDADTFGDIALEGCESDDDSDEDENKLVNCDKKYKGKKVPQSKESDDKDSDASKLKGENDEINFFPDETKKSFARKKSKLDIITKFEKTSVDSQFLSVRESEWIADNDVLGENYDLSDGEEQIDMFGDVVDEKEATTAMYNSFFDAPSEKSTSKKIKNAGVSSGTVTAPGVMSFGDFPENDDYGESEQKSDDGEPIGNLEKSVSIAGPSVGIMSFGDEAGANPPGTMSFDGVDDGKMKKLKSKIRTEEDDDEDRVLFGKIIPLIGDKTVETKSTFEKERDEEKQAIEDLEMENLEEKPWHLRGEVLSENRPVNSTLEEHLDFNVQVRPKPIITEDITSLMEKMILSRIKSKDFDDVERQVKPTLDPSDFKKKMVLEQEKSKLSLAQLYEQDYIKERENSATGSKSDLLTGGDDAADEMPEHKEIKKSLNYIFRILNAMSNYHYTPYARDAEVKIVSNLPAVMLEESTPVSASDATLLAPQEIVAPLRKALKGDTELSKTDKLSRRRSKKLRQKYIGQLKESKMKEGIKKKGKSGVMSKDTSLKVVEKAIKDGHIKMLDNNSNAPKSSSKFFEQLTNIVSAKTQKRKNELLGTGTKKSKRLKSTTEGMNMKKLLL